MPRYNTTFQPHVDPGREPVRPGRPSRKVLRERIPIFVDPLDCLLAVWVAEATLDIERDARLAAADAPDGPLPPRTPATGRRGTAAWSRA
jgi:hypothetical protein